MYDGAGQFTKKIAESKDLNETNSTLTLTQIGDVVLEIPFLLRLATLLERTIFFYSSRSQSEVILV